MKKFISSNYVVFTLGILFVFALWSLISYSDGAGNFIFPNPVSTFNALGNLLSRKYIYECIGWTLLRTVLGFAISFIFALIFGLFTGILKKTRPFFKPLIIIMKCAPTAVFIYLFLSKGGSRFAPMFIVILLSFPILYEAVVRGMDSLTKEMDYAMRVDSSFWSGLFKVRIPLAFPYIALGLASSFSLSLKTEIMAEIISGDTNYGLGSLINAYRNTDATNLSAIFAVGVIAVIIILIISLGAYFIERAINNNLGIEKR